MKAPAIKRAELKNLRIKSTFGALNARLQICRSPHMNSMLVAYRCHKEKIATGADCRCSA
jgi:hypothetical protein